jgi:hypothetical protein
MHFHLALDSGAYSLFRKHLSRSVKGALSQENISVRANIQGGNSYGAGAFLRGKQFHKYFEDYVEYVVKNQKEFDFCVSIDVIFDPKKSYEYWIELQKQGIKVMPVLHPGEDLSWLRKYMDHTDYLGIGGLGANTPKSLYVKWATEVFKLISDKKGIPKWKTHGFAMTAAPLLRKFPWSSVDSTSPLRNAHMGSLLMARPDDPGGINGQRPLIWVAMSPRRSKVPNHYLNLPPTARAYVDKYCASMGTSFKELSEELDGVAGYVHLYALNLKWYFKEIERKRTPFDYYVSGPMGGLEGKSLWSLLEKFGVKDFRYLGTFYSIAHTDTLLKLGRHSGQHGNQPSQVRTKARPTLHRIGRPHSRTETLLPRT